VASRQCRSWGLSKQETGDLTPGNIIKRCFWGLRWLCLKNQHLKQHLKKSNNDYQSMDFFVPYFRTNTSSESLGQKGRGFRCGVESQCHIEAALVWHLRWHVWAESK
jgi:hypothetical protein